MDAFKKKAAAAASAGAGYAQKGAAAAAPLAAAAAGQAVGAAKAAATKNETVANMVEKHGDKAEQAKDFAASALQKTFMPSKEMQDFAKNPTQDALVANPDIVFQGLALLSSLRHPQAAAMKAMMSEGMDRAANSQQAEQAQQQATKTAINSTLDKASGGVIKDVPPEVSDAALKFVKENPAEVMNIMKMAAKLK